MIKKLFPTGRVYSKKQTRVTVDQHIFKSGLIYKLFLIINFINQIIIDYQFLR